jgi:hypothetical protein
MPPKPVNMLSTAGVGKPVAFNGLAAKAAPAVNMPQHAGVAAGTAQMVKNNAVTGQPASVNPTPVQQAAQNTAGYFNQNFGGSDKYAADQNKRYADAYAANDTALMGKLIADSQRVGYAINTPTAQGTPVLSYNDALGQANQQLDPGYQQAVAAAKAQGWTNSLDADQLGTARGGSHSGLAADLQNKVHMNTENEIKDLAAKKAAQAASIAQDLVNRSQDNAYRDKTFNRGVLESDRTFNYGKERDKRGDFVDDRNYDRGVLESDRSFNYGKERDKRGDFVDDRNYNRGVLENDRSYNRGVLENDRAYNRGIYEDNRDYNRGVYVDDRNYDRGVLESDRNYGLSQDDNDRQWASLDYSQQNSGSGGEYQGMSPNQLYDAISSNYTVTDPSTKKNRITADPAQREQMFLDVIDATSGMPDATVTQLLRTLGLTKKEIETFSNNIPK